MKQNKIEIKSLSVDTSATSEQTSISSSSSHASFINYQIRTHSGKKVVVRIPAKKQIVTSVVKYSDKIGLALAL